MIQITKGRRGRATAHLAAAASLALIVAACGSASKTGASASPSTTAKATSSSGVVAAQAAVAKYSAAVSQFPPIKPVTGANKLSGKSVWFVPISTLVYPDTGSILNEALGKLGITVHVCDGNFVPTAIAGCLSQAGSSGANAVLTGAVDYASVSSAINALVAKGVPVVMADTVPPPGTTSSAKLTFDYDSAGTNLDEDLAADSIIADSNGKANILFLAITDSALLKDAAAHAMTFLADKCPGCSVTRIDYNTASLSKLSSEVNAALISKPATTYIFGELDPSSASAIAAIRTAGLEGKVKYASAGGGLPDIQNLATGDIEFANAGVSGAYNSWRYADDVVRLLAGQAPSNDGTVVRMFTKSNVGSLTLTPAQSVSNAWYGSDAYKANFLAAWGAA